MGTHAMYVTGGAGSNYNIMFLSIVVINDM